MKNKIAIIRYHLKVTRYKFTVRKKEANKRNKVTNTKKSSIYEK